MGSRKLMICVLLLLLCLCNLVICKEIHDDEVHHDENLESSTWAGWAKDKISEGLGLKSEESSASHSAMEGAKNAKDKITDAAAG